MKLSKLFSEKPIAFYPALRKITGSITGAILLQQLLYWWDKKKGDDLYKTVKEMEEETSLTKDEQLTAINKLKQLGFISVKLRGIPAKRHFFVDINKIEASLTGLMDDLQQDGGITDNCMEELPTTILYYNTENTPKNTTITEQSSESDTNLSEKKEYVPKEITVKINILLEFLKKEIGCTDFKEDQKTQRIYAKHILNLSEKIGKDEIAKRFRAIISDSFKSKNCGSLAFLYKELKGFVEPKQNSIPVF